MNKKLRLFLFISFILFVLSIIAFICNMILSYYKVKTNFTNDDMRLNDEVIAIVFVSIWMIFPCLGSELSLIRSIYKILKHKPNGYVKLCYILSASLAFFAFTFQWLSSAGLIRFVDMDGYNYTADVLLFIEWPLFIISFILGSIPIKYKKGIKL